MGYCFGLTSAEDVATGRIVGHSGGYPGYSALPLHRATAQRSLPSLDPAHPPIDLMTSLPPPSLLPRV